MRRVKKSSGPVDKSFKKLSDRLLARGDNVRMNAERLHKSAAKAIANNVVVHTPLWSGQARLNWTARTGKSRGPSRFVNVPRSNSRVRKSSAGSDFGKTAGGRSITSKASTGTQGSRKHITVDPVIASTAHAVAMSAITEVIDGYKHPIQKDAHHNKGKSKARAGGNIYLSNSLKYIGKLWSGSWKSNPRTLSSELEYGIRKVQRSGHLLDRK